MIDTLNPWLTPALSTTELAKRKTFLLRIDPRLHDALQKWAEDELRSLNGQIEYLLRQSAKRAGRLGALTGQRVQKLEDHDSD